MNLLWKKLFHQMIKEETRKANFKGRRWKLKSASEAE